MFESKIKQPILTYALIAICLLMVVLSDFLIGRAILSNFFISNYQPRPGYFLPEVMAGELWRLITPVFMHASVLDGFGVTHILFNMVWLKVIGGAIEQTGKMWKLGLLVGCIGVVSNLSQYLFAGPFFVGMSGVVYGLLGYVWAYGHFNPYARLQLNQQLMMFMIAWLFICWSGLVGNVANMAHTAGLLMGLGWGWVEATLLKRREF